ncbi:SRPBCC domain-containing protein, partial [Sphaerisporangium rubeum]
MDLKESFEVEAPASLAWSLLRDPVTVAECFPGARLGSVDGDVYAGSIVVKFGPTTVAFQGQAEIAYDDADRTVTINARGRDGRGATRASAAVTV